MQTRNTQFFLGGPGAYAIFTYIKENLSNNLKFQGGVGFLFFSFLRGSGQVSRRVIFLISCMLVHMVRRNLRSQDVSQTLRLPRSYKAGSPNGS